MRARRTVLTESGALLAVGAVGFSGGLGSYLGMDARMQSSALKPGMYVVFLSVGLMLTALAYAFFSLRNPVPAGDSARAPGAEAGPGIVGAVLGVIALYALLVPLLGYPIATLLFLLAQFRLLGVASWLWNAVLTVTVTIFFYAVFVRWGGMIFPHGGLFD